MVCGNAGGIRIVCFYLIWALTSSAQASLNPRVAIPILCYHGITSNDGSIYSVSPDAFRTQLEEIGRLGLTPITLSRVYKGLWKGENLPDHPMAITFDDGLRSVWTEAAPLLERYGYPATLYVNTQHVGPARITWDEIRSLMARGWDIGSHGHTHKRMVPKQGQDTEPSRQEIATELMLSYQILEDALGKGPALHLAYPYGLYDRDLAKQVRDQGFETAVSVNGGSNNSLNRNNLMLSRVLVSRKMSLRRFRKVLLSGVFLLDRTDPPDGGSMAQNEPEFSFFPAAEFLKSSQPWVRVQGKSWNVAAIPGGYRATPGEPLGPGAHIAEIGQIQKGRHFVATRLFWVRGLSSK